MKTLLYWASFKCACAICVNPNLSSSSALSSKKISLCHTVGSVSELAEKTIYFLFYCSQRMSLLPESWTLEDHLEAWNIPAWLPWGECRPAFQSEGGSRAGEGPRSAGSGLSQVRHGTSQSSWTQRLLCSLIHGKLALFKRACAYLQKVNNV